MLCLVVNELSGSPKIIRKTFLRPDFLYCLFSFETKVLVLYFYLRKIAKK